MRRRKKSDEWMPQRVYRGKSKYEYHPPEGGSVSLCDLSAPQYEVWESYYQALNASHMDLYALRMAYCKSERCLGLAPATQRLQEYCWKRLGAAFGKMDIGNIKRIHVRQYMDIRGEKAKIAANRELAHLKTLYKFAIDQCWIDTNPTDGVLRFIEKGRNRYVEDEEYYALYDASIPAVQVFMEFAYICAARGQDIRKILLSDLRENGVLITQAKTGKKQVKLWNDRLRAVVNLALEVRKKALKNCGADSVYLIVTNRGTPYSENGLKAVWRQNRERAEKATGRKFDFTFHDLKAKGISDYPGDKQEFSGHKSRTMMERYNRSPDLVEVINFPNKS